MRNDYQIGRLPSREIRSPKWRERDYRVGREAVVLLQPRARPLCQLDLDRERVEWRTLPDGGEALFVNLDAATGDGDGAYFACHNDELHAVGSLAPLIEGAIGLIAIKPDHTRQLVHVQPDPLAQERDD